MDDLTALLFSYAIGFVIGLGSSFLSWWILFHVVTPVIEFAGFISKKSKRDGSGYSYRIKFKNTGRRAIIGIEAYARLVIDWDGNNNWSAVYIPLSRGGERKIEIPKVIKGEDRVFTLFPNLVEAFKTSPRCQELFKAQIETNTLTMEDVLSMGEEAKLRIYVSGYDEFSGAKKMFESSFLFCRDIKSGVFKELALGYTKCT